MTHHGIEHGITTETLESRRNVNPEFRLLQ